MYSDEVKLSGNNVMQVLYLANKYMVPSLAEKCTDYLRDNLKASNVFCILPNAQKFGDKELEDRCWEVIEIQTEEAVTSDEFVTVERSLVESVVKRERLNVKEVELFKAVDRWATKECERQGRPPDGDEKRRILGEEIVKAIRFPLMSEKEFVSVVFDSYILTIREVGDLMKHYNDVLTSSLPFLQASRVGFATNRCCRFINFLSPHKCWKYSVGSDGIVFTVDKPIKLYGVQHFGSEGGEYTVSTEVKDLADGSSLEKQSGVFHSAKADFYYVFDVKFDCPVCLVENKEYELVSLIKGPMSWHGEAGQNTEKSKGVTFTFRNSRNSSNGTTVSRGQFPALLIG